MLNDFRRLTVQALSVCSFLALATPHTTRAQSLTFTTFAGPTGGAGSVDGTGSAARFNLPSGITVDGGGTIYVACTNDVIRRISPAGEVTTYAGFADHPGSSDGTGGAAHFLKPAGMASDGAGNLYVADSWNHTIRKITRAGVVTTLAGSAFLSGSADGTGKAARFNTPMGVAVDGGGNVYVADQSNHTIRRVTAEGVVTTLAGTAGLSGSADGTGSAARFNLPAGVATDSGGNVYVADSWNNTIRKITPAGVVTTLAGTAGLPGGNTDGAGGAARFFIPSAIAADSGGNLYVTNSTSTIRKITPDGVVTTLAGTASLPGSADGTGSAALFAGPQGIATDGAGNVYVADTGNHTIRMINTAGAVTTLAGSAAPFGSADGTGSAARFNYPAAVTADSAGNVYVADMSSNTIRRINPAGLVTTLAGSAGLFGSADGIGSAARFSGPRGVAVDNDGSVYVADTGNHTIRKITAGMVTTLAGSPGLSGSTDGTGSAARFSFPNAVAIDSSGNVFVSDPGNRTVRRITPAGAVTTLAGSPGLTGSADGVGSAARFASPTGVASDGGGNVYVADADNYTIRKITPAGVVTTLAGTAGLHGSQDGTGSAARFYSPAGVATDSDGNVYVSEGYNSTIRKITPAGVVTTLAGQSGVWFSSTDGTGRFARFNGPAGVAVGGGTLYVADTGNVRICVGRPALPDQATIDASSGPAGVARQLDTSPRTATSWEWRLIRQPSRSRAALSSTTVRNPMFIPDAGDSYVFQLTASDGVQTSITTVTLTATPGPTRQRAVRAKP